MRGLTQILTVALRRASFLSSFDAAADRNLGNLDCIASPTIHLLSLASHLEVNKREKSGQRKCNNNLLQFLVFQKHNQGQQPKLFRGYSLLCENGNENQWFSSSYEAHTHQQEIANSPFFSFIQAHTVYEAKEQEREKIFGKYLVVFIHWFIHGIRKSLWKRGKKKFYGEFVRGIWGKLNRDVEDFQFVLTANLIHFDFMNESQAWLKIKENCEIAQNFTIHQRFKPNQIEPN